MTTEIRAGVAVEWRGNLGVVVEVGGEWAYVRWAGVGQGADEVRIAELNIDPT